ncbi:hypothetical protein PLEOSDRAFT_1049779, partial [Pleurotus ostreatus PC15]
MTRDPTSVVIAEKSRVKAPGFNAQGIRSLHIKAAVASHLITPIRTRLDSGADITLMSQDYWNTLPDQMRPSLKTGSKVQLQQLTCSATILSFVNTVLYAETKDHRLARFDIEAYIVQDMQVPLLLGEDFMTSYEIGITRKSSGQCTVYASSGTIALAASTSDSYRLGIYVRKAYAGSKFLQHKQAKRAKHRPPFIYNPSTPTTVVASESVTIAPGHCSNISISLPNDQKETWFIESSLLTEDGQDILAAPATLVTPSMPYVPIANPMTRPLRVRRGDI